MAKKVDKKIKEKLNAEVNENNKSVIQEWHNAIFGILKVDIGNGGAALLWRYNGNIFMLIAALAIVAVVRDCCMTLL